MCWDGTEGRSWWVESPAGGSCSRSMSKITHNPMTAEPTTRRSRTLRASGRRCSLSLPCYETNCQSPLGAQHATADTRHRPFSATGRRDISANIKYVRWPMLSLGTVRSNEKDGLPSYGRNRDATAPHKHRHLPTVVYGTVPWLNVCDRRNQGYAITKQEEALGPSTPRLIVPSADRGRK